MSPQNFPSSCAVPVLEWHSASSQSTLPPSWSTVFRSTASEDLMLAVRLHASEFSRNSGFDLALHSHSLLTALPPRRGSKRELSATRQQGVEQNQAFVFVPMC